MMGLDISHDAWYGAYSAFSRWREKLAEVVGIPLPLMQGHYGHLFSLDNIANDPTVPAWAKDALLGYHNLLPIAWESLKPDALHVLLHHSDCDGIIEVEHLTPLADRLVEILPLLPDGDGGGHIGNWRAKTQKFIDGCRLAASLNESLLFE
jgi:hypothetical protein